MFSRQLILLHGTLRLNGQEHYITARWEGISRGKLVVLVDGEIVRVYENDYDVHATAYAGNFK